MPVESDPYTALARENAELRAELATLKSKKREPGTNVCRIHDDGCQICGRKPLVHVSLEDGTTQMLCPWCLLDIDWRRLAHEALGSAEDGNALIVCPWGARDGTGHCMHPAPTFGHCAFPLFPEQCPVGPKSSHRKAEVTLRHVRRVLGVDDDAEVIEEMDRLQRELFHLKQTMERQT